jgi:phosphomevalonate kinase
MNMYRISSPGGLLLAGDLSFLEAGNPSVVAAVDKRVFVNIEQNSYIGVRPEHLGMLEVEAEFDGRVLTWKPGLSGSEKEKLNPIKTAIETANQYVEFWRPFRIRIWRDKSSVRLGNERKDMDFNSSAATFTALTAAFLKFNRIGVETYKERERVFKLAVVARYRLDGKLRSSFDVAGSVYGGLVVYNRFSTRWFAEAVKKPLEEVVDAEWPGLGIEPLGVPENFDIVAGWTGKGTAADKMVKQMADFRKSEPDEYKKSIKRANHSVRGFVKALRKPDEKETVKQIKRNRTCLRELGEKSKANIETPELKKLSDIAEKSGAAGKPSVAGGGELAIAVCFSRETVRKVKNSWREAGFYPSDASLDYEGVRVEKILGV